MAFKFRHDISDDWCLVNEDKRILRKWEMGDISTKDAAKQLGAVSGGQKLTEEEFTELANGLGYWRENGPADEEEEEEEEDDYGQKEG